MHKKTLTKMLGAMLLAGSLVVSMAACTSTASSAAGCAVTKSGSNSDKVKVSGSFGATPKVTFAKGLSSKTTERTVIDNGKGSAATDGSSITVNYSVYNATNGKQIDTTGFGKSKAIPLSVDTTVITGLYKAIKCSTAGTRIAAVIPPADAFGSTGQESLGIGAKDSIVFVIDVDTVKLPTKTKVLSTPSSIFPKVTFDSKGVPTIAKPSGTAPTKLQVAYLKKGTGVPIKSTDTVTLNYTGIIWATGAVFDSSWTSGTPASFVPTQVVPGFGKALVGQPVGSKIIVIIPPADGYGSDGQPSAGISGTDDLVFVIDIISRKAA
ncbi:MAG: peptidylprolyl isomerase [Microbacteriaceae bacterium]|nr:peptidylprolyl isomerase [Microbacteriaceae bacterium]